MRNKKAEEFKRDIGLEMIARIANDDTQQHKASAVSSSQPLYKGQPRRLSGPKEAKKLRLPVTLAAYSWLGDFRSPRPSSYAVGTHSRCSLLTALNNPKLIFIADYLCLATLTILKDDLLSALEHY